ncbi:MAG: hypothetical protein JSU73_08655, partial [candidate division WOR-3 bacterium]
MKNAVVLFVLLLAGAGLAAQIEPALQEQMAEADDIQLLPVMIVLEEQLDAKSIINTIKNKRERWETTVYALKSIAARTQA